MGQDSRSRGHSQDLPSSAVGYGVSPSVIQAGRDVAGVLAGHSLNLTYSHRFFNSTNQAGYGNSVDKTVQPIVTPDLFILRRLSLHLSYFQQSVHLAAPILNDVVPPFSSSVTG